MSLLEEGNNGNEEISTSTSNATRDMLHNTNIAVKDDTNNLESEACDHFSIREYVAQASERDPHSCSPFETDKLTWGSLPPAPRKKFRRWDCSSCVSKVISTDRTGNGELVLSSDQSANIGTCLISFLGTSVVPHSIHDNSGAHGSFPSSMNGSNSKKDMTCETTGGCHLQATICAASPDTSDYEPLSTFIKSGKRRVMQEQDRTKNHTELEKSKEIHKLMATTSTNSDLPESPVVGKISKVHGKKARKVRSIAEIIGTDKSVAPQNECTSDDSMAEDLTPVKEKKASEVAGKLGLIKANLKKRYKALEVVVPPLKECTPVDCMDADLTPVKENQASEFACKSGFIKNKPKKSYKTVKVVVSSQKKQTPVDFMDEDLAPIKENHASEFACKSELIKAKSKKKYKALEVVDQTFSLKLWLKKGKKTTSYNKCAKIKNLEGQNVTYPSSWGLSLEKPGVDKSDEKELLIGTVVRRRRTKKPRKFVCAAGTGDEIACMKSCHKPLQLIGNKEANSKEDLSKIMSQKRKIENSKPAFSSQRIRKKKQKISENISHDIPMDIVELLAKSLREKHLTDETDSGSNNNNSNSNSRESPQNMLPSRTLINFSTEKSAFNRTSEIDTSFGYMKQFPNGPLIQQPSMGRCVDLGRSLLQINSNPVPVPQTEVYRNDVIPATHLLQLMNASTSSSQCLNLRGFANASPYNAPVFTNQYQNLNQNPCKLFRPQPRLGVYGSQLQKEITSPTSNCGTQSGYRIGNGPIPAESICIVNRNPADFTVIDENSDYMIDGHEIKPINGAFCGNYTGHCVPFKRYR
ncbi:protein EMBRYONIC FLOWER 1-like protein [Carex littledalei]|uniref:Protein EMBRYONIC FLOWER 1-like protein n=1 Tax=Carex littledalei TaxID=544730 RepID=A0A833V1K5_9POAL|nr:protein EMBRYONIC FLOWER 1-like protein [Carex littledalei]